MNWPAALIIAFLAGSIPFSWLVGLALGTDIRTVGSKNVGATNLGRTLGRKWFMLGFSLDFAKGFVPVFIAGCAMGVAGDFAVPPADAWLWLVTALAAVLGHMFSPWVGFKGGKGVATGLGAMLAVWPMLTFPAIGAAVVFTTVLALWRYVSAASMVAAIALPIFAILGFGMARRMREAAALDGVDPSSMTPEMVELAKAQAGAGVEPLPFIVVTALLAILVIVRHRKNLERLASGLEPKVFQPKGSPPPPDAIPGDDQTPARRDNDR